jgi:hypothetical protein
MTPWNNCKPELDKAGKKREREQRACEIVLKGQGGAEAQRGVGKVAEDTAGGTRATGSFKDIVLLMCC